MNKTYPSITLIVTSNPHAEVRCEIANPVTKSTEINYEILPMPTIFRQRRKAPNDKFEFVILVNEDLKVA